MSKKTGTKKIYISLFAAYLFFCLKDNAMADITVYAKNPKIEYNSSNGMVFSVELRAVQNSNPITLDNNNTILIENLSKYNPNMKFSAPDAQGFQKAEWITNLQTAKISIEAEIVVTHNNEVGSRNVVFELGQFGLLRNYAIDIYDSGEKLITELYYRSNSIVRNIYIRNSAEASVILDSITFTYQSKDDPDSYGFYYLWGGTSIDNYPFPPPKSLIPSVLYHVAVFYNRPPDNPYRREYMIFHYAGGFKRKLPLITKEEYDLPLVVNLKLLSPKGGEILAPCEDFLIEWRGQAKEHPVLLHFSPDNGKSWLPIDTVAGDTSQYLWKVPDNITTSAIVRVSQTFNRNNDRILKYDSDSIKAAAFNFQATRALTVSSAGNILEWDLYSNATPTIISEINEDPAYIYNDIDYLKNEKKFIVLRNTSQKTQLMLYNANGYPNYSVKKDLPDNFRASKISVGKDDKFIALSPAKYSNSVQFLDTAGNLITYYRDNAPVINFVIEKNTGNAYISLLNNKVKILSLDDFPDIKVIKEYDFSEHLSVINGISISRDMRLMGLTLKYEEASFDVNTDMRSVFCNNYIYDNETETFFKNINTSHKDAIGLNFNFTGNIAIIGNETDPQLPWLSQISLLDLTNKLNMEKTSINAFTNTMLGFELAEDGNSLIAYSYYEFDNCKLINFSLPESDQNDVAFTIERPVATIAQIQMDSVIMATDNQFIFEAVICNTGLVPAIFDKYYFKNNLHFKLLDDSMPDTVDIGKCKNIRILASPVDTGDLKDELIFVACGYELSVPLSIYSKNRNLQALNPSPVDLGEACIYERDTLKINLFKNLDSVDILVNKVELEQGKHFKIISYNADIILKPQEIYTLEVEFMPQEIGFLQDKLIIFHSNQQNVTPLYDIVADGIGTFLQTSHNHLYFIPEIHTRTLTVTNTGESVLYIDSIYFSPEGNYNVITNLPLYIDGGEQQGIDIEFLGDSPKLAQLHFVARPCVLIDSVYLGPYKANVSLKIPEILADPRDKNVDIPVNFQQNENYAYKGKRYFNAEFEINPRIFYPTAVESKYGIATITKNYLASDDKRIFGIQIEGDFVDYIGTLFNIKGAAGLCETDISPLNFIDTSSFFGAAVDVAYYNTTFRLINLCDDRRIIRNKEKIKINSFIPNPAKYETILSYEIIEDMDEEVSLEIYDLLGNKIMMHKLENNRIGNYEQKLIIDRLTTGTYRVMINYGITSQVYTISVIR